MHVVIWFVTHVLSTVLGIGLVAVLVWWGARHRQRAKDYPHRQRLPRLMSVIGWLILLAAALTAVVAFTDPPDDALSMRIAAFGMALIGLVLLVLRRNWYVDIGPDRIDFRTAWGREHRIEYADVDRISYRKANGQTFVDVTSTQGVKMSANVRLVNLDYLELAARFHNESGRWPRPGELGIRGVRG